MTTRADIRADFIKRLFAVAISVGFAATLIDMNWVQQGTLPTQPEWEQIAILITGLVATVLSWDGYLASISEKPLTDYPRFGIDIVLVFIYMFFLISSKQSGFWLPLLALIFVMYVIWDFLTVRVHPGMYNTEMKASNPGDDYRAPIRDALMVYWGGFLGRSSIRRGPIITLSWAVYFAILASVYQIEAKWQVFAAFVFAIAGLSLYRWDKARERKPGGRGGLAMWTRGLLIIALLAMAGLYFCIFRLEKGTS